MSEEGPRRVASIEARLNIPVALPEKWRESLVRAAKLCPVRSSLNSDTQVRVTITWADGAVDEA
jgi:uncharacterized OsmC-like protein